MRNPGNFLLPALLALGAPAIAQDGAGAPIADPPEKPDWAFETSDIPVDPGFRFGKLDNGMRYVIRQNERPEGTALIRLHIGSGSLAEREDERGLAHFLEHMAFNGSRRVPEGEMVKLLEREGLAFGADTNASTGFEATQYRLDLPRNDPELLDTALMLMRETASELTLDPDAIDRERGVIVSERRDRRNFRQRELEDRFEFLTPGARYTRRLPIGVLEVLQSATAAEFRAFYEREYVPANAVLLVIGDYDPDAVEKAVETHFSGWKAADLPVKPEVGPVDLDRKGETDIYLDSALSERITISRHQDYSERADSVANRQQNLLARLGYAIINRRLQRLTRAADPPFRAAGFGTGDIFEAGRTTNLVVDTSDRGWRMGLKAAVTSLRTSLAFGFSEAEIAEQIARTRTAQINAVSADETRSNSAWMQAAVGLVEDGTVPSTALSSLERFEKIAPTITPAVVLAAVRQDAAQLVDPLIRFRGRTAPEGGELALRQAWTDAALAKIEPPDQAGQSDFAYTDFGQAGEVTQDTLDQRLGIRTIRFANGVMLNLKQTDLARDRVSFRINLDGGNLLDTRENPLATSLARYLAVGGLGAHSSDELQTLLAGRNAGLSFSIGSETFVSSGTTTPADLELQLQLQAALLTDPGYREEAEARYRRNLANVYKTLRATPNVALANSLGAILSDFDPRFSIQPEAIARRRSFEMLKRDIGDRLATGAIEIALVGDFDPEIAIAQVAATFGALPARDGEFRPYERSRLRGFTADRSLRIITHEGEEDKALLHLVWPTRDASDLAATIELEMLERIARLALQEELRERLGKTYSPSARSSPSRTYPGYGSFSVSASVDVADLDTARSAVLSAIRGMREAPVDDDTLDRARQPLVEALENRLKSNASWLSIVDRAQSRPEDITRHLRARGLVDEVTADRLRDVAQQYLSQDAMLEVRVLPRESGTEE